jgi:hypothetical protein
VQQWAAIVLPLGTVNAAKENVYIVGTASKPPQYLWRRGNGGPMMQMAKWAARIGAVSYVLWGAFHLVAANAVYALAEQSTVMVRARLLQDAFYLLFFAVAGILMAVILNWRNDKQGYWMNGTLIGFADLPFVLFVLVPGLIPWWPGLAGPLLWLIAFVLTSIARVSADSKVVAGAHA